MEQLPLISVLIPTFNVEKYVTEAIESICNQTYVNLEIIIVDDCSTDMTFKILTEFTKFDNRIKLFRNKENLGIVGALNFALAQANGKYIARMDGDDISYPHRIDILYKYLASNPQIGLIGSQTETIDEAGNSINFPKWPISEEKVYLGLKYKMSTVLHYWLARIEVYKALNGYRIPTAEDYDFLLRLLSSGIRFTNVNQCLYKVRIRFGNTVSLQGSKQRLSASYAWKLYNERLESGNKTDSFSTENFSRAIKCSNFSARCYQKSASFLNKAVVNKHSKIKMALYICLSLLSSPWIQGHYFYNRYKIKTL